MINATQTSVSHRLLPGTVETQEVCAFVNHVQTLASTNVPGQNVFQILLGLAYAASGKF